MRSLRLRAREERGQVLVMSVMFMGVMLGAAALTLDLGRMATTRRQMQNAADSSALAGAWSLRDGRNAGIDAATEWALDDDKNDLAAGELINVDVVRTTNPNDTVQVDVRRNVPYIFGRVLGLNSQNINATASAQVRALNGVITGKSRAFPFAIWGGNRNQEVRPGNRDVVFHSNHYEDDSNIDEDLNCSTKPRPAGCTWDVPENFKGYFHWQNGYKLYIKPTSQAFSQGGNAYGTSDYQEMYAYYQAGTPVLLPVITRSENPTGNGLNLTIIDFVCVKITYMDTSQGNRPWTGDVVECAADGLYDGPNTPPSGSSWVPILIR